MRYGLVVFLVFLAMPAWAGTISVPDGQMKWQSNQCTAPQPPASLTAADSETAADDMNVLVTQYNQYANQTQAYMDCLSKESQADANAASQTILQAGRTAINDAYKNVQALNPIAQKQKP